MKDNYLIGDTRPKNAGPDAQIAMHLVLMTIYDGMRLTGQRMRSALRLYDELGQVTVKAAGVTACLGVVELRFTPDTRIGARPLREQCLILFNFYLVALDSIFEDAGIQCVYGALNWVGENKLDEFISHANVTVDNLVPVAPTPSRTVLEWKPVSELPEGWLEEERKLKRMAFLWDDNIYIGWPLPASISREYGSDDGSSWEESEFAHKLGGVKWWAYCPLEALPE